MKRMLLTFACAALFVTGGFAGGVATLIVTSSNNPAGNQLLVFDGAGTQIQTVSTNGLGGVSGNAGGIAATRDRVAVVNFLSQSVSIFDVTAAGVQFRQLVSTVSRPVSVAFGKDHLYVLGTTTVESHRIAEGDVDAAPDGSTELAVGDGSSAQVGVLADQLLITEKANTIETVALHGGAWPVRQRAFRFRRAAIRRSVSSPAVRTATLQSPIPTRLAS